MKSQLDSKYVPPLLLCFYSAIASAIISSSFLFLAAGGLALLGKQALQDLKESQLKEFKELLKGAGLTKTIDQKEFVPAIIDIKETKFSMEVLLTRPPGISLEDFQKKEQAISEAMGNQVEFENRGNLIKMIAYKEKLKDNYPFQVINYESVCEIPIGVSRSGPISLRFDDQNSNLLVGGVPGSGKSVFLRQAITNLILTRAPDQVKLFLMDLKNGVEFSLFKESRLTAGFASNETEAEEMIGQLEREMMDRYKRFQNAGCLNIRGFPGKMPRLMLIIDEYANVREFKQIQAKVDKILRMGRAAGVFVVICTQRPSSETIPGIIKANCQSTISFSVRNRVNSQILLDNDKAVHLEVPGRCILQTYKDQEVQVYYLTDAQAKKLIQPYKKQVSSINTSGVVKVAN